MLLLVLVPYFCICLVAYGDCLSTNGDKRLFDLEERFAALASHVEQLERREQQNQAEIQSLKTELRVQKQRTDALEKLVKKQSSISQVDGRKDVMDQDSKPVSSERKDKGKIVNRRGVIDGQRIRRLNNEQPVAFYATLHANIQHSVAKQIVKFDHVITNVGTAYNASLGAFIAPVPGIYVFSVSLMSSGTQPEHYTINKNNNFISNLHTHGYQVPHQNTGETAILQLAKGDNVDIQIYNVNGTVYGNHHSAFSGFLLQEDYGNLVVVG